MSSPLFEVLINAIHPLSPSFQSLIDFFHRSFKVATFDNLILHMLCRLPNPLLLSPYHFKLKTNRAHMFKVSSEVDQFHA